MVVHVNASVANKECNEERQGKSSRAKEDTVRCLAPVFRLPFFQRKHADLQSQMVYHSRFSVELLVKEQLINANGVPTNLSAMVTHLFKVEPANFILNRLLMSGLLHEYLKKEKSKVKKDVRASHLTVKLAAILGFFMFRQ